MLHTPNFANVFDLKSTITCYVAQIVYNYLIPSKHGER